MFGTKTEKERNHKKIKKNEEQDKKEENAEEEEERKIRSSRPCLSRPGLSRIGKLVGLSRS